MVARGFGWADMGLRVVSIALSSFPWNILFIMRAPCGSSQMPGGKKKKAVFVLFSSSSLCYPFVNVNVLSV